MFQICKVNEKQRDSFMGTSSGYILHSIIDLLVDDLLHILLKLKGNLDDIEDVVFDDKYAASKRNCVTSQGNHNSQKDCNSIKAHCIRFQQRHTKIL